MISSPAIEKIINATIGTKYENHLYLVGGAVRDEIMGKHQVEDIDIVYEGDALGLADYLNSLGITDHPPVTYPRFGTAMVSIGGKIVELVSARKERYSSDSRKPDVELSTLYDDILRRDFTINTLLENIHTNEILDLTALGVKDIKAGIIRTPRDPNLTFYDDPLRMLRAIRFSVKYGFIIEEKTYDAIVQNAKRLAIISRERIRDEFAKILLVEKPSRGIKLLKESGLLERFVPDIIAMVGVTQGGGHAWDIWDHTMRVLDALPNDAGLVLRLAALFHDIAKPITKRTDKSGSIHFYGHDEIGAKMTKKILSELRFPNAEINRVARLVEMHIRIGEYSSNWKDSAVKRLMRDAGQDMSNLLTLAMADRKGAGPNASVDKLLELEQRMENILRHVPVYHLESPLNGNEIMQITGYGPGPIIRSIKNFLLDEVIEGRLAPDDKDGAISMLLKSEYASNAPNLQKHTGESLPADRDPA